MGSKCLTGDCKYFWLHVADYTPEELEDPLDFVQSGFLSILVDISLVEDNKNKMDTKTYKKCYVGDKDFLTLESAKASFPT